jgi:putative salt-induced outer membrane protein
MKALEIALIASLALVLAAQAQDAPKPAVSTKLNLGLSLADGNSETLSANASLVAEGEKDLLGSFRAGVEGNYGESTVDGVEDTTAENAKLYGNAKKTLSPMTFGYLDASLLYDDVAAIDYRATLGPGFGFYLVKNDVRSLSLEAGPSYVWEKLDGAKDDYLALRFAQRYTCQVLPNAKLVQSLEYVPQADDFDNYRLVGEVGVEAAMSERLGLRVVLQDAYQSIPADGKERNDLTLVSGLSLAL